MAVNINPKGYSFAKEIKIAAAQGGVRKSAVPARRWGRKQISLPTSRRCSSPNSSWTRASSAALSAARAAFRLTHVWSCRLTVRSRTGRAKATALSCRNGPVLNVAHTSARRKHYGGEREVVRHSAVETDTLVRRDSARGLALAIDQTFLDTTNSGSEVKPASITNCISPVETLSGLMAGLHRRSHQSRVDRPALGSDGARQSPVNPNVGINGGEFMGAPAFACRSAPDFSLVLVDPTGLTFAMGELEYETSRYGTVQMVDVPTQMSDGSSESPSDDPSQRMSCRSIR